MKTIVLSGSLACLLAALCPAQSYNPFPAADADADHTSTSVVHRDGTYTTTHRDTERRRKTRQTMRKNGTIVMRSVFTLDEAGREQKGTVYDGQGNVLYLSEFKYDALGEILEERVFDARANPVRRLIYQTDKFGKKRKPFCMTYTDGRPIGDLMALDDPTAFSTTSSHAHSTGTTSEVVRSADGSSARVSGGGAFGYVRPGSRSSTPAASTPEKKKPARKRLRLFRRR